MMQYKYEEYVHLKANSSDMSDLQLPSHYCLPDITAITAPVFELKHNSFLQEASEATEAWFRRCVSIRYL